MKLKREISSTEKLLDLIRTKSSAKGKVSPPETPRPRSGYKLSFLPSRKQVKTISIGVDLGKRDVKLVKIDQQNEKERSLSYKTIKIPDQFPRESPQFFDFLRSELNNFCPEKKNLNIWTILPFDKVQLNNFNIPKVAKKRAENAIYWSAKKEMAFDEEESVFDYEIKGEIIEQGVNKTAVLAMAAPKKELAELRDFFSDLGFPLKGVSLAPFTIQNLFISKWITVEDTVASIYIGWNFSRIDIFSKGSLIAVRSIKTGVNGMVESLKEELEKKGVSIDLKESENLFRSLSPDSANRDEDHRGFEEAEIFEMVKPAINRIITQMEMTIKNYASSLDNDLVSKLFISTAMPVYKPMVDYIGEQMGIEAEILDPLSGSTFDNLSGMTVTDRAQYALCMGLALSDNSRTPNLFFTYKNKKEQAIVSVLNKVIISFCTLLLIAGLLTYGWQKYDISTKEKKLQNLDSKLKQLDFIPDPNTLMAMIASLKQQQQNMREYLDRYKGTVILGEISALTPRSIKILNVNLSLSSVQTANKDVKKTLELEGIVFGKKDELEQNFADYITRLKTSPVFSEWNIVKKTVELYRSENVLHFTMDLRLS